VVDFPFPAVTERKRIWRRVFPTAGESGKRPHVPVGQLELDRLAAFDMTGGSIANAALNAAFLAAERGGKVEMELVLEAIRQEYVKLERPIVETDFARTTAAGRKR
jgi:hypothetical protein